MTPKGTSVGRAMPAGLREMFLAKKYGQCLHDLEILANAGSSDAVMALAHIYFYGGDGIAKDYAAAGRWWGLAANRDGSPYALYRLGVMHYQGTGVTSDHMAAYKLYRRSALRGNAKARAMVGLMQMEGDGVRRKPRSARIILMRCARDKRLNWAGRALSLAWLTPLVRPWIKH